MVNRTVLDRFNGVSLEELSTVQLLNRTDTKFIFSESLLDPLLASLTRDYLILDENGNRSFSYHTIYFDTADFLLYKMHHNGKPNRFKVRVREYLETHMRFFEIKYRIKDYRTDKLRLALKPGEDPFALGMDKQIAWGTAVPARLKPSLTTDFVRISLLSKRYGERITIDSNLRFSTDDKQVDLPGVVVAEVKQSKGFPLSPFLSLIKKLHLDQTGFSKYSMGIALCTNQKHNMFKPNLIRLHRLLNSFA